MKTLGIILFLILTANSYCQNTTQTKVDSLNNILNNTETHDTTRAYTYYQLSELLYISNLDTILPLCSKAIEISENNLNLEISNEEKTSYLNTKSSSENSFGVYHYYRGNKKLAIDYFKKSLETKKQTNDLLGISQALNNLGIVQSSYGELTEALNYYLPSLKIRKTLSDKIETAFVLNNIGSIHVKLGNYASAFDYYNESLDIAIELKNYNLIATSYNNLGITYSFQGIYDKALKNFELAKANYLLSNDKFNFISSYSNIANVYLNNKEYQKALSLFFKALEMSFEEDNEKIRIVIFSNISLCYKNLEVLDSAKIYGSKGLDLAENQRDKIRQAMIYTNIGSIFLAEKKFKSADSLFDLSLQFSTKIKAIKETETTLRLIYTSQIMQGNTQKAKLNIFNLIKLRIRDLEQNFVVLSEREKELYFINISSDFQLFYEFAANQKDSIPEVTELAYNNALRNKGLLLKSTQAMKLVILNSKDNDLILLYNKWIDLKKSIADMYTNGKDTEKQEENADILEKELISASSDFKDFKTTQNGTWQAVQKELKPKEIAIEFIEYNELLGDEHIYAALILTSESDSPKMVKICTENEIESILGVVQVNNLDYIDKVYGKNNNVSQELYNIIWKPMESQIGNATSIYLSPTGLLHKISFSALKTPSNLYLCDLYKIHILGSTGKLLERDNTEKISSYTIKLFGGINFNKNTSDREVWSYLPGTLNEVESIYQKLQKKKIDVELYSGDNASEETFKNVASNCNILHIATHGFFYPDPDKIGEAFSVKDQKEQGDLAFRGGSDQYGMWSFVQNKNPLMRSGVVLAGANDVWVNTKQDSKNDGVLTAQEVATIDMRKTELVVLSACETGLGDIKGSEGVYGLQRSFKMAGVKYIIMSLWQVPDKETSEFMSLFYKSVLKTNNIEESFRITQLKMRKKYPPYYWAAFVLIE